MAKNRSTALYPHPFSKAYWRDAAAELKDTKMLVVSALMIALRIALKPLAIPLGPQLSIQTAMLATALGAMIFGPVVAIPAAMISDTIGFMIYPTGDYFLPFMLTEIASTMIYALCLYRSKVTPSRVVLSRFFICFFVNVILQQLIYAWWYVYIGNPEQAKSSVLGIMTVARIFKNLAMFPIESVVLTIFLRFLLPITNRAKLTFCGNADMKFDKKQVLTLVVLFLVGCVSAMGYLGYRYNTSSRAAEYSTEERVAHNQAMDAIIEAELAEENPATVSVIGYASRPLFGKETSYSVAYYAVDEALVGTADFDGLWSLKKTPASKHESLTLLGNAEILVSEATGEVLSFAYTPAK